MKTNKIREQFLNNKFERYLDQEQENGWIQMTNLKALNNKSNYNRLEDEVNQKDVFYSNDNKKCQQRNAYNAFADKPIVPKASYNFEPNQIVMNGLTFVRKDTIRGSKKSQIKPKKPEMQVQCEKCSSLQMIPANSHAFICFNCDSTQKCRPQFGIFICGSCERQVWYPYATSQFIKCTKCGTINKVPTQEINFLKTIKNKNSEKSQQQITFDQIQTENQKMPEKYFAEKYPQL